MTAILIVLAVFLAPVVIALWVEHHEPQRYLRLGSAWCQEQREAEARRQREMKNR